MSDMTNMDAKIVEVFADLVRFHDREYHLISYSGRGMYGERCVAVTDTDGNVGAFFSDFLYGVDSVCDIDDLLDEGFLDYLARTFKELRVDNMGKGSVYYFPNLPDSLIKEVGHEASADDYHN